jgi:hypothetical protein
VNERPGTQAGIPEQVVQVRTVSAFARASTASIISGVSFRVFVFCWLT